MSRKQGSEHRRAYEVNAATAYGIPEIIELQRANLIVNGGMLSVDLSSAWIESTLADMPVIIARRDGRLVGYLMSSKPDSTAHVPVSQAKFAAYPAHANSYNCGPMCIATSERGHGLAAQLFDALRVRLPGREAVAFSRRDNVASRRVQEQLGFKDVAGFSLAGVDYVVAACTH